MGVPSKEAKFTLINGFNKITIAQKYTDGHESTEKIHIARSMCYHVRLTERYQKFNKKKKKSNP